MAHEQSPSNHHYEPRIQNDFIVDDTIDHLALGRGPVLPFKGDGDEQKDKNYGAELRDVLGSYPDDADKGEAA